MPCSSTARRRCSSCDEDCRCGCQSNIYSLPWEILEQILENVDPVTLLSVERTCKMFFSVVSDIWAKYCKRRNLSKPPTPLCLGFDVDEDSFYSYDKAIQLSSDENQKWRLMAVRSFLIEEKQCVFCRFLFVGDFEIERFKLSHDILLCPRCTEHFSMSVTHETIHLLNDAGVETQKIHFTFGPLLFSSFIKTLRANDYDEKRILEHLKPHFGNQPRSPLFDQSSNDMPLVLNLRAADSNSQKNRGNICSYFNRQQGCSCIVTECSRPGENPSNQISNENTRQVNSIQNKKFYAISLSILICNIIQFVHSSVIVKDYKMINIGSKEIASFVLVAFIDIVLLCCLSVYVLWSVIRRFLKNGWNKSFTTILQCFLLACFLTEVHQILLIAFYVKDLNTTTKEVFVTGIPQYTASQSYRDRIDWIQSNFYCCGITTNATHDWSMISNTSATSGLPPSCCSADVSSGTCSLFDSNPRDCPTAVYDSLFNLIKGFLCTTVCCSIAHLIFILYILFIIYRFRSARTNANSASVQTIFTMM